MNILAVEQLSKTYGERTLFEEVSFFLNQGAKAALIARNGSGKSTLLRIMAGTEGADSGTVRRHPDARVGYLPQEPELDPALSVIDTVFEAETPRMDALRRYEHALATGLDGDALDRVVADMDRLEAWDAESRAKQILGTLAIDEFERPVGELSGGQRKRVALARVLIGEPDLLVLDEPTNHLDLHMVEWLEDFLARQKLTLLMVTHDRYFLDRVCGEILELEPDGMRKYRGNYAHYLEKKAEHIESRNRSIGKAQAHFKTELEWARRMPRARGTKSKVRMEGVEALRKQAAQRTSEDPMAIDVMVSRLGSKVLEFHGVAKAFGERVLLEPFSYKFRRRERLGVLGRNGSGKTTMVRLMTGELAPDRGKVVHGDTLVIGHYAQDGLMIPEDKRVIDVIRDIAEYLPMTGGRKLTAASLLERFLFDRAQQQQYVSTLSGGERRRLHLLTVLMGNPNFLILDEPTNDLDIPTMTVLEEFLLSFEGCLVVVSHDRYFMDKIVEHCMVLDGKGGLRDYPGNYSQYRDVEAAERQQARDVSAATRAAASALSAADTANEPARGNAASKVSAAATKTRLSYKEKLEFERLEGEIDALEKRRTEIETALGGGQLPHDELHGLSDELASLLKALDQKSDRWLELGQWA